MPQVTSQSAQVTPDDWFHAAQRAQRVGDNVEARKALLAAQEGSDPELRTAIATELAALTVDRAAMWVGLSATLLYVGAWLMSM